MEEKRLNAPVWEKPEECKASSHLYMDEPKNNSHFMEDEFHEEKK